MIRAVATAGDEELGEIFCPVSNSQFRRFPVGQIFTTFEHNTSIGVAMKNFGTKFRKFYRKG